MADDATQEQAPMTQEEWNKALVGQLDQAFTEIRATNADLAKQNRELASKVEQLTKPAPTTPAPQDYDKEIKRQWDDRPSQVISSLANVNREGAREIFREEMGKIQDAEKARSDEASFWNAVWSHPQNADVTDLQHQVLGLYNQMDPNVDRSERVNAAIAQVRQHMQTRTEVIIKNLDQQEKQKKMTSSGPMQAPWMNALRHSMGDPNAQPVYNEYEELMGFVKNENARQEGMAKAADRKFRGREAEVQNAS